MRGLNWIGVGGVILAAGMLLAPGASRAVAQGPDGKPCVPDQQHPGNCLPTLPEVEADKGGIVWGGWSWTWAAATALLLKTK